MKENPPFSLALSFVQRWSLLNFAIESLHPAWEDAPQNGAKLHSGLENVCEVICEAVFNAKAQRPPCGFLVDHACRYALCRMVPLPSVTYTRFRGPSLMTSQESMASVLLSTRANLPQHEYENRAVFFMRRRKASHNA